MTKQNVMTPTGRIVWGDLYTPQTKDNAGKPLVIKAGPDAGKPTQRFAFGLAIAKGGEQHWSQTPWGAVIWAAGHTAFPQAAQRKDFAWKVLDGDSTELNKNNRRPCDKEGHPGHWVLSFSSSFAPRIVNSNGSAAILEPNAVKCGYFVQVSGTVDGNSNDQNPGVYLNHGFVALQGYGPEIVSGPDPASLGFGGGPAPVGMSAAPVGAMAAPPVTPAPPAAAAPPAYQPPPPPAPAPPPPPVPTAVAPAPAFLAPAAAPPPPPPPPPAPTAPQLTAKANGATYQQMVAAGWTDATLRQHGFLA
jgi:hypothetical protein